ncbi:hypothetical protein ABW20_dc0101923 [Dactylellina cionopaga]|nr:hypothetical protein ABW20_dc0101923 [Dactylellina cionopaga]
MRSEIKTIALIADQVDELKERKQFDCPVGGPGDLDMDPDSNMSSLTFYILTLLKVLKNFDEEIKTMKSQDLTTANKVLERFGYTSIDQAEVVRSALVKMLDVFMKERNLFKALGETVNGIPGFNTPQPQFSPADNLFDLSLIMEAGKKDWRGFIKIDPKGRRIFINLAGKAYEMAAGLTRNANKFATDAEITMSLPAFTALIDEPDPDIMSDQSTGSVQDQNTLPQGNPNSIAVQDPGPEPVPAAILNNIQDAIGPIPRPNGNEEGDDEEGEEEGEGDEEEEEEKEKLPWDIPGILRRIGRFGECWQAPLFSVYDLALNQLGPIPDPTEPKWIEKTVY